MEDSCIISQSRRSTNVWRIKWELGSCGKIGGPIKVPSRHVRASVRGMKNNANLRQAAVNHLEVPYRTFRCIILHLGYDLMYTTVTVFKGNVLFSITTRVNYVELSTPFIWNSNQIVKLKQTYDLCLVKITISNSKRKVRIWKFQPKLAIWNRIVKLVELQARDLEVWGSNPGQNSNFPLGIWYSLESF